MYYKSCMNNKNTETETKTQVRGERTYTRDRDGDEDGHTSRRETYIHTRRRRTHK